MAEILTGRQLRDRAEACLDQRKPDKATLIAWIGRGADRIDRLTGEVEQLKADLEAGGTQAALILLENAEKAAEGTLNRVQELEASTQAALDDARTALETAQIEARAAAEPEAEEIVATAVAEAAEILAEAHEAAQRHLEDAESQCREKLDAAAARADRADEATRSLVSHANRLDARYRERVSAIRSEADALVSLVERFDALPASTNSEDADDNAIADLASEIIDLRSWQSGPDTATEADSDAHLEEEESVTT